MIGSKHGVRVWPVSALWLLAHFLALAGCGAGQVSGIDPVATEGGGDSGRGPCPPDVRRLAVGAYCLPAGQLPPGLDPETCPDGHICAFHVGYKADTRPGAEVSAQLGAAAQICVQLSGDVLAELMSNASSVLAGDAQLEAEAILQSTSESLRGQCRLLGWRSYPQTTEWIHYLGGGKIERVYETGVLGALPLDRVVDATVRVLEEQHAPAALLDLLKRPRPRAAGRPKVIASGSRQYLRRPVPEQSIWNAP